jgi:DNA (cytosine-5)-methyltransferase 1
MKTTSLGVSERLSRVDELLEATYRSADLGNFDDPLDETVFILISQQTRDAVYRPVFKELQKRYPKWADALAAPVQDIEAILRPAGFWRRRAIQLLKLLAAVEAADRKREAGPFANPPADLTLDFLRDMPDAEAEAFLVGLPGIGPKSARCVLSYALGRPAFAVDTHVLRIFGRLGIGDASNRKQAHDPFQQAVPPRMRRRLHVNLVHHGRAICREQAPDCGDCVLVSFCRKGQRAVADEAAPGAPVAVDLFAGAGGMAEGFRQAGYRIAGAVEAERNAAQTYRFNHPGTPVIEAEIEPGDTAKDLRRELPHLGKPDLVLAGPPCQGYSAAGSRRPEDPRNALYRPVARIAQGLKVKGVVLENVPGVRRVNGHSFLPKIKAAFEGAGFRAPEFLVSAASYGVPQRRRRFIFLIYHPRRMSAPTMPAATHAIPGEPDLIGLPATPTVGSVLAALPAVEASTLTEPITGLDGKDLFNASTMAHSDAVVAKIAAIPPGGGPISYRRLETTLARTIIAGHRALPVHPTLHRTISAREAAALQSFADTYRFLGGRGKWPLQVANSVPPALARTVATHLAPLLDRQISCRIGAGRRPVRGVASRHDPLASSADRTNGVVRRARPDGEAAPRNDARGPGGGSLDLGGTPVAGRARRATPPEPGPAGPARGSPRAAG